MVKRFEDNPIVCPGDVRPTREDFEVMCAFNPGATRFEGKDLLLVRVAERPVPRDGYVATAILDTAAGEIEPMYISCDDPDLTLSDPRVFSYKGETYLTSISHIRVAVPGKSGKYVVSDSPAMMPETLYETYGIEDPRITFIEGAFYINYSAISPAGVLTALARTCDFREFERLGNIFAPDNKDIAIFPEKIGGRYYAFHRPSTKHLGTPSIWLASSENLLDWGRHELVLSPRAGMWDSERVGCGAAPLKTDSGWLELYHASDHNTRYCTGAILLDLDKPWKVIARSKNPFLYPEAPYETQGFLPNVIFHSGLVDNADGTLTIYYGAADECVCAATVSIKDIIDNHLIPE